MQGALVRSLVGELRLHVPCSTAGRGEHTHTQRKDGRKEGKMHVGLTTRVVGPCVQARAGSLVHGLLADSK